MPFPFQLDPHVSPSYSRTRTIYPSFDRLDISANDIYELWPSSSSWPRSFSSSTFSGTSMLVSSVGGETLLSVVSGDDLYLLINFIGKQCLGSSDCEVDPWGGCHPLMIFWRWASAARLVSPILRAPKFFAKWFGCCWVYIVVVAWVL